MASRETPEFLEESWRQTGNYLRQAIRESAEKIGDENLATQIEEFVPEDSFPDAGALVLLEKAQPGIADQVITRAAEIQKDVHDREREIMQGQAAARAAFGRLLVRGVKDIFHG